MGDDALELTVPARARHLAGVRNVLRRWLRSADATGRDAYAIVLACTEACANAVDHAYGAEEATFYLRAENLDGIVGITVRDSGSWRSSGHAGRGRGLQVIEAFMDEVEISRTESGTVVRMSKKLATAGK